MRHCIICFESGDLETEADFTIEVKITKINKVVNYILPFKKREESLDVCINCINKMHEVGFMGL